VDAAECLDRFPDRGDIGRRGDALGAPCPVVVFDVLDRANEVAPKAFRA
jgi:hypothetical protein